MKTHRTIALAAAFTASTLSGVALAQSTPPVEAPASLEDAATFGGEPAGFQFSLWDSAQLVDEHRPVHGVRINLPYGSNAAIHGFDFGIASRTARELRGLQFGLGGYVGGAVEGVQYNYVLSIAKGNVAGWQNGVYAQAGSLQGVQTGIFNYALGSVEGVQAGVVNLAPGDVQGAELSLVNVMGSADGFQLALVNVSQDYNGGFALGVVNYASRVDGLQFGVVNVTDDLHGVQIGLANIAANGVLPFMPVVNAAL